MKQKRSRFKSNALFTLGLGAGLLAVQPLWAEMPYYEEPSKKSKSRNKSSGSKNGTAVRVYPDAFRRDMHVVAKYNDGKEVDFFVFDLEGTLRHNYKLKSKDHYRIKDLEKGSYIYRVFSGDEETASGKFEIR